MNHLDMRLLEQAAAAAVYKPARWNDDETALLVDRLRTEPPDDDARAKLGDAFTVRDAELSE